MSSRGMKADLSGTGQPIKKSQAKACAGEAAHVRAAQYEQEVEGRI
jgi:hypothetical protein